MAELLNDDPISPIVAVRSSTSGAKQPVRRTGWTLSSMTGSTGILFYSTARAEAISDALRVEGTYLSAGVILFAMRTGRENDFQESLDKLPPVSNGDHPRRRNAA